MWLDKMDYRYDFFFQFDPIKCIYFETFPIQKDLEIQFLLMKSKKISKEVMWLRFIRHCTHDWLCSDCNCHDGFITTRANSHDWLDDHLIPRLRWDRPAPQWPWLFQRLYHTEQAATEVDSQLIHSLKARSTNSVHLAKKNTAAQLSTDSGSGFFIDLSLFNSASFSIMGF